MYTIMNKVRDIDQFHIFSIASLRSWEQKKAKLWEARHLQLIVCATIVSFQITAQTLQISPFLNLIKSICASLSRASGTTHIPSTSTLSKCKKINYFKSSAGFERVLANLFIRSVLRGTVCSVICRIR